MATDESTPGKLPAYLQYPLAAILLIALVLTLYLAYSTTYDELDLGWSYYAARYWLQGVEPYSVEMTQLLRPNDASTTASGFPYPFPVILLMLPLTPFSLAWASTIWGFMSIATVTALSWATRERPSPLAMAIPFVYFPFWAAMEQAQWAPLVLAIALLSLYWYASGHMLLAGSILPLLGLKPQIGLAMFAAVCVYQYLHGLNRRWFAGVMLGSLLIWGGSLLIEPGWPQQWLQQLRNYSGEGQNTIKACTLAGALAFGFAAGLAGLAWRRRDASLALTSVLLAGMLALPMRSVYNETLLLLPLALLGAILPRGAFAVAAMSWCVFLLLLFQIDASNAIVLSFYVPLLALGYWRLFRYPREKHHGE